MSTKTCPYCAEDIKAAAIKCRYCGSPLDTPPGARDWHRDLDNKMISGVCSGLAREFGVPATALRIGFIIATFAGGWGLLIYVALWVLMPGAPAAPQAAAMPPLPPAPSETGPEPNPTASPRERTETTAEANESANGSVDDAADRSSEASESDDARAPGGNGPRAGSE